MVIIDTQSSTIVDDLFLVSESFYVKDQSKGIFFINLV